MSDKTAEKLRLNGHELDDLTGSVLKKGTVISFQAGGRSMWPFIKDLDRVTLKPMTGETIGVGDIVGYTHPDSGNLLVHRIIKKERASFLIKGDNARFHDGWIEVSRIKGVVSGITRKDRAVTLGLRQKKLIALLSRKNILIPIVKFIALIKRILLFKR